MKNRFTECQKLHEMERIIEDALVGKQFWGDINLSLEEYEVLCEQVRKMLAEEGYSFDYVIKGFPVALTTIMVFLARYKYNTNFWGLLGQEIGYSLAGTSERTLGNIARTAFSNNGFDFSDVQNERRKYMEPILYEAGLPPESSLNDLFYVLSNDTHQIFDPQMVIDELLERRSYQIRTPMRKFLKHKSELAAEFIMEVHEAMVCVNQGRSSDSHYVAHYVEWKKEENSRSNSKTRKKKEFQTKPYISFDAGKKGLCIVLPKVFLEAEWLEEMRWEIVTDAGIITRKMMVLGDERGRFIETISVAVCPSSQYEIELIDEEGLGDKKETWSWEITGIPRDGFIIFNAQGRLLSSSNPYVPYPTGTIVLGDKVEVTATNNVLLSNLSFPNGRPEYRVCSLEVVANSGSMSILCSTKTLQLNTNTHVEISVVGHTLFGLSSSDSYRLFTIPPIVEIMIDEDAPVDGFNLRVDDQQIPIADMFSNGFARIPLNEIESLSFDKYGTYSVRLYQNDRFKRFIDFVLVPAIKTDYSTIINWSASLVRRRKSEFRFAKIPNLQLEFPDCVVNNTEDDYIVEYNPNRGVITLRMSYDSADGKIDEKCELPVNPLESALVDSLGEERVIPYGRNIRLSYNDFENNHQWLSLRFLGNYKEGIYSILLRSVNGIAQRQPVSQTRSGSYNLDLSVFYDTIRNSPLPVTIELCNNDKQEANVPLVVISDTVQLYGELKYLSTKNILSIPAALGECDLTVVPFRRPSDRMKLSSHNAVLNKTGMRRGYRCPVRLSEGIYVVEANREISVFEDESDDIVELTNGPKTLYISSRDENAPIQNFSDCLDQLMKDVLDSGEKRGIAQLDAYRYLSTTNERQDVVLSRFDCERIIALACFVNAICSDEKKKDLKTVMTIISEKYLNSSGRLELIRTLVDLRCTQSIFDECKQEYKLLLFRPGVEDALCLAERVEGYSIEISLLLRFGADDTIRNTIGRGRYREIIGQEAIRDFLSVPDTDDSESIKEEQKKFLLEQQSRVRVRLSKEVSGEMEPIRDMLKITYNRVRFVKEEKPDTGIYFDRIRFVDQYVNWHSLHHDSTDLMYKETQRDIKEVITKHMGNILKAFSEARTYSGLRDVVDRYGEALQSRKAGNLQANMDSAIPWRYFYIQGIAAFLTQLPAEYQKYGWGIREAEAFMLKALKIAPKISQRDILMASLYIYLIRKEKKPCQ